MWLIMVYVKPVRELTVPNPETKGGLIESTITSEERSSNSCKIVRIEPSCGIVANVVSKSHINIIILIGKILWLSLKENQT